MPFQAFSLADICRAKVINVEIKNDTGNIEGIVYLKEPSAPAAIQLQEKIEGETSWSNIVLAVLALTLSDKDGNSLVNTPADHEQLKLITPRVLIQLREPSLAMLQMGWSPAKQGKPEPEIVAGSEDIDSTLARLDDQVAEVYRDGGGGDEMELTSAVNGADVHMVAVPIDGNENLHLDQDPGTVDTSADPNNPFVGIAEEPK